MRAIIIPAALMIYCLSASSLASGLPPTTDSPNVDHTIRKAPYSVDPSRHLFLKQVRRLASTACSDLGNNLLKSVDASLAKSIGAGIVGLSKVQLPLESLSKEAGECSFARADCFEDQTAVMVRVEILDRNDQPVLSSQIVVFELAESLPLGYRDTLSLSLSQEAPGATESTPTVQVTAVADKFWLIEEEALFGESPNTPSVDNKSETTDEQLHTLVVRLFGPDRDRTDHTSDRIDISDLVKLIDSSFR